MGKNREVQLRTDCSPRRLRSHSVHKPAPSKPQITIEKSAPKSMDAERRAYTHLSRLQIAFKLRFQTLFLSQAIYHLISTASPQTSMPQDYRVLVSANLAMKYHQIYPPRISNVLPFLKTQYDFKEYCRWEMEAFGLLQGNLNIPTAQTQLDSLLENQPKEAHLQAYYLVELSQLMGLTAHYSLKEICVSVKFLMSPISQSLQKLPHYEGSEVETVQECAKSIIQARTRSCQTENILYKKYKQSRYLQVSQKPFLLQTAI